MRTPPKTYPAGSGPQKQADSQGRLDILLYRLCEQYGLPAVESFFNMPGLALQLRPYAETIIAEAVPPVDILKPLRTPRRRLCS